ncbi:MAG: ribonuclease H [Chloroflexota bacterium]
MDALARQARLEIAPAAESSANVPQLYLRSSCQGNPGPGGWGVVMIHGDETAEWSGSAAHTTNNRMELTAAVEGLRHLPPGSHAQLFTTSDYLFQGATLWLRGWRRREWRKKDGRPIANADLWQELYRLQAEYKVTWINAKGFDEGADDGRAAALRQAAELATAAVGPVSNLPSTG